MLSFILTFADLLHLSPNSPDAKVFQDFAKSAKGSPTASSAPGKEKKINPKVLPQNLN